MTTDSLRCTHCSAPFEALDAERCSYCGAAAPGRTPAAAPEPPTLCERLERLARQSDAQRYAAQLPKRPAAPQLPVRALVGVGILALGLMLGFAGCGERGQDSSAPPFLIAGTILALSGLFAFRSARVRQRLPVRRDFRAVAGKRTCVSGGEPTTTDYFVTLESCSGARKEHSASATLYGQVAEGDLGVADVHGGELVRFRRFELDA